MASTTTSSDELILYDLPSRPRPKIHAWSGNTWKTRLVLNYKAIPYKTHWIPFHALQATLGATNLTPHPQPNWGDYTVPTIRFPDGKYMMDSAVLAPKLEEMKPEPSLHLELELHKEASKALGATFNPLLGYFMPRIVDHVVALEDVDWFHADREKKFGMSMAELERTQGGEGAFEKAQPGLDLCVEVLTKYKKDEGPFILGSAPSYGDFVLVAGLHCFMILGKEVFDKIVEGREALRAVYEACGKWLVRDD